MAKSFWSEKDQRLVTLKQSNPVTEHDDLPLPGGKKISDVDSTELARLLASWGVAGASASNSRERNLALYSFHLNAIKKQAAEAAVNSWLRARPANS